LWRDGELTAVIDWEDACLGDPLIDLAQSRSEIAWIFGPAAVELFTGHYRQQQPLNDEQLPYWDLCAALRQIRLVGADLAGYAAYFGGIRPLRHHPHHHPPKPEHLHRPMPWPTWPALTFGQLP
jgi:hypothetical protein